jgi:hypothetical protein
MPTAAAVASPARIAISDHRCAAKVGGGGFDGPSHFTFRAAGDQLASMTMRA